MPARTVSVFVVCAGVCFAGAHLSLGQEATSANLPDQFQTGEMIQTQRPNKQKAGRRSQTIATVPQQDTPPVPDRMPVAEETSARIAPAEEKKVELNSSTASMPPNQKSTPPSEPVVHPAEEQEVVAVPSPKKPRPKKRRASVVRQETPIVSAPVPMSLSVAQSMAITAPLPDYTYDMRRRNLSGTGLCVVTVDSATGTVTNATMFQSTGSPVLDKMTTRTFKSWRFKPGTVSEVRIPISYE